VPDGRRSTERGARRRRRKSRPICTRVTTTAPSLAADARAVWAWLEGPEAEELRKLLGRHGLKSTPLLGPVFCAGGRDAAVPSSGCQELELLAGPGIRLVSRILPGFGSVEVILRAETLAERLAPGPLRRLAKEVRAGLLGPRVRREIDGGGSSASVTPAMAARTPRAPSAPGSRAAPRPRRRPGA